MSDGKNEHLDANDEVLVKQESKVVIRYRRSENSPATTQNQS